MNIPLERRKKGHNKKPAYKKNKNTCVVVVVVGEKLVDFKRVTVCSLLLDFFFFGKNLGQG